MNRSAIDKLAGVAPLSESTMTTSMPMTAGPTTTVAAKPMAAEPARKKKPKLSDLLMKRRLHQEGDEKPVIPANAQPDDVMSGVPNEHGKEQPPELGSGSPEAPLPTSLALVAPDTTPNAEMPLDPSQVPQPASTEVPTMSSPVPIDSGDDVLRTLVGEHQRNFKPELITDPTAAAAAVSQMLSGESPERKSDTASATAAQVMSEATAGKQTKPHHNPDSMNRSIAVTRQILGMG